MNFVSFMKIVAAIGATITAFGCALLMLSCFEVFEKYEELPFWFLGIGVALIVMSLLAFIWSLALS